MALVIDDRVRETTNTAGTGAVTLAGAVTGFQTFAIIGNGNTTYYCISGQGTNEWEVGLGTYNSSLLTLTRTTVLANSAATEPSPLNFSVGTKDVFVTYPAEKAVYLDASGNITPSLGSATFSSITDTGLTSGRVTYAGTGGLLQDSANLTFDGTTLTNTGNAIISDNSANAALRITQVGAGNALLVEDSANPDATPFVVTSAGDVLVGTDTKVASYVTAPVQIAGANGTAASFAQYSWNVGASSSPYFLMNKSRGATVGTRGVVSSGDYLGFINFCGDDGASFIRAAEIVAQVDGTPGTNDMPGRLTFGTTADGASSPTERMRINSSGEVGIGTASLGTSKLRVLSNVSDAAATYNIIYGDGTHTLTADNAISFNAVGGLANLNQNGFNATISLASGGNLKGFNSRAYVVGATGTVTSAVGNFADVRNTGAGVLTNAVGFQASFANSGGGTLTNTYGVYIGASTAGTNNYGFYSNIAAATGAWNFYANGTANNYFAGNVGIGSTSLTNVSFRISNNITGASTSYAALLNGAVQPTVTASAVYNQTTTSTAANGAVPYTVAAVRSYSAAQGTFNADSTVTAQIGFAAESNLTGATSNYGFWSNIASGTGRYNFFANGTADNYFAGNVGIGTTAPRAPLAFAATTGTAGVPGKIRLYDDGASIFYGFGISSGSLDIVAGTGGSVTLYSNGATERMRIASSGTISLGAAPGSESLRVTPVASAVNYVFVSGAATGGLPFVRFQGSDSNIGGYYDTTGTGNHIFRTNVYGTASTQFVVAHTASAVNYLQVTGSATGGLPNISAQGSDANINIWYFSKGTGGHGFATNNTSQFYVAHTASAVNYLQVTGAATGGGAVFSSQGSDANVPIDYRVKGASYHVFTTNAGSNAQFLIQNTASAVNYLQATGGATGNATTLSAQGSDSNIGITLTPKGTGVVRDQFGNIRAVPQSGSAKTSSYTLATGDVGQFIQISTSGSIIIPNSTFAAGDIVSLFNNTSGSITVTCSTTNAYIAGTDTNKTSVSLATRGVATILFITSTLCVISGNVS